MNHLHCHRFVRDEDYLPEIRAGGSRADIAISCLYLKYRKRAFMYMEHLISKNTVFKGVSEDLLHDAFIIMIDKIQREPIQVGSLAGFWIGIGKNLFLNQLKKDQRTVLVSDVDEKYPVEDDSLDWIIMDEGENERMDNIFTQLGPRCRQILLLWINQFTMHEIAAHMNLASDAMARKMKYNCFKKLKELAKSGNT